MNGCVGDLIQIHIGSYVKFIYSPGFPRGSQNKCLVDLLFGFLLDSLERSCFVNCASLYFPPN